MCQLDDVRYVELLENRGKAILLVYEIDAEGNRGLLASLLENLDQFPAVAKTEGHMWAPLVAEYSCPCGYRAAAFEDMRTHVGSDDEW